jgi:hypothetical protein
LLLFMHLVVHDGTVMDVDAIYILVRSLYLSVCSTCVEPVSVLELLSC